MPRDMDDDVRVFDCRVGATEADLGITKMTKVLVGIVTLIVVEGEDGLVGAGIGVGTNSELSRASAQVRAQQMLMRARSRRAVSLPSRND